MLYVLKSLILKRNCFFVPVLCSALLTETSNPLFYVDRLFCKYVSKREVTRRFYTTN